MSREEYRAPLYDSYVSSGADATSAAPDPRVTAYFRANILPHLPPEPSAAVLDVACGSGTLIALLRQHGYGATRGVDRSEEQVERARQAGIDAVTVGDAFAELNSLRSELDVVVALDFLEHLEKNEVMEFLGLVRNALRPRGVVILRTTNGGSPFAGRIRYGDFTHELAFTPQSLRQLLTLAGFEGASFHEIRVGVHGPLSAVRFTLWKMMRLIPAAFLAVETGILRGHVLSQNLVATATRPDRAGP